MLSSLRSPKNSFHRFHPAHINHVSRPTTRVRQRVRREESRRRLQNRTLKSADCQFNTALRRQLQELSMLADDVSLDLSVEPAEVLSI